VLGGGNSNFQFRHLIFFLDCSHSRYNKPDDYHSVNPPRKLGTFILV